MVTAVTTPVLGQQLYTMSLYMNCATHPMGNADLVGATWEDIESQVLEPNGIPASKFDQFPETEKGEHDRALAVNAETFALFSDRVEELAKSEVNKALFNEHEVSPDLLLEYAAEGLIDPYAVRSFNMSAANYLEKRLDESDIRMGDVIDAAIGYLQSHGDDSVSGNHELILRKFFDAAGLSPSMMKRRHSESEKHIEEFSEKAGAVIKRSIKLLYNYGKSSTIYFFKHHNLHTRSIENAMRHGLFEMADGVELYEVFTAPKRVKEVELIADDRPAPDDIWRKRTGFTRSQLMFAALGLIGTGSLAPLWSSYVAQHGNSIVDALFSGGDATYVSIGFFIYVMMAAFPLIFYRN